MKILFHYFKMFLTCILFFFILPSCNDNGTTDQEKTEQDSSADTTLLTGAILITGGDITTGDLELKDNHGHSQTLSRANHGSLVQWQLVSNPEVMSINTIAIDNSVVNNIELFQQVPRPQGPSGHWQGTIKSATDLPSGGSYIEKYLIEWTDKQTPPVKHTYDPFIQVNPSKLGPGIDTSQTGN